MKSENKKARLLHQESREYRGLPRVQDYKTRANRVERRAAKQQLKTGDAESAPSLDEVLAAIARDKLGIETLVPRNSDSLDFHDIGVWRLRDALEAAYRAGLAAAKEVPR